MRLRFPFPAPPEKLRQFVGLAGRLTSRGGRSLLVAASLAGCCLSAADDKSPIFPEPQRWTLNTSGFSIDDRTAILVPRTPSENDLTVARGLSGVLSERHDAGVPIQRVASVPKDRPVIVMGLRTNPLVKQVLDDRRIRLDDDLRPEGYTLFVQRDLVVVAGDDDAGTSFGFQSLRQLIRQEDGGLAVRGAEIRDWPYKPFRGIKLYLPGPDNIPFFKRFVRDFMALYKFNKLILEVNACMRFERHPELNAGWIEFAQDLIFSRRDRPAGPDGAFANSTHHDTADGSILEKRELAELVAWCEAHHIEVIPEIPSLSHVSYLLTRHRELAEIRNAEWPDTYCPLHPGSHELLFDVLDEYIEVMRPKMIHVGHDEWRTPIDVCERCRGKHLPALFSDHLNRIHAHLAGKNIRTAIWGDHLIEQLRGKATHKMTIAGRTQTIPGGLSPAEVEATIPKDILIFNWFWGSQDGEETGPPSPDARFGEMNDIRLEQWGFEQVYGNFNTNIRNYDLRSRRRGVIGAAPSAWVGTTEFNFGKDVLANFLACAPLVWSSRWIEQKELAWTIQQLMPEVRRNLSGRPSPRSGGDPVVALALPLSNGGHPWGDALVVDTQKTSGTRIAIPVGEDPTSIVFTHASARPGWHEQGYKTIYNTADTGSLLGWYEIVYEDGFIETVPIRYSWNILERNSSRACYMADATQTGASSLFFAFEWLNPRLGKVVREIRICPTEGATDLRGKPLSENQIAIKGIEIVRKRPFPEPVQARATYRP